MAFLSEQGTKRQSQATRVSPRGVLLQFFYTNQRFLRKMRPCHAKYVCGR